MKTFAAFCRVYVYRQGAGASCLALLLGLLLSPVAYAEKWRPPDSPVERNRPRSSPPATAESADHAEMQQRRAELRRERKMEWLRSANGANGVSDGSEMQDPAAARARMGGMSREERHRLRSDIREAGFSAYSSESNRSRP